MEVVDAFTPVPERLERVAAAEDEVAGVEQ
jgi:hypothetical protein